MAGKVMNSDYKLGYAKWWRMLEDNYRSFLKAVPRTQSYSYTVAGMLIDQLKETNLGIEYIADQLSMSVRSLQMKLKSEGTSYQKLLNSARKYIAIACLRDAQLRKSEIASILGFSEISVFSRTFKKWTGQSPSEFQAATEVLRIS